MSYFPALSGADDRHASVLGDGKGTTAGRVFAVRGMGQRVRRLGPVVVGRRLRPPSEALGPFALPDLSDGRGAPCSETTLAAFDVETRSVVDEAAASAADVVLANCGVIGCGGPARAGADDPGGVLTMGRSPSITIGDARDGIRVEHVKGRGMVRWSGGQQEGSRTTGSGWRSPTSVPASG